MNISVNGLKRKKKNIWKSAAALAAVAALTAAETVTAFAGIKYWEGARYIEGPGDWCFLEDAYNIRQTPFTETQCQEIMDNLLSFQEELKDAGIYFVVFICPDKEEIYGELLPAEYPISEQDPIEQLVDYLHANAPELPVVYPKEQLLAAREAGLFDGADLYYANDSHWNEVGGYVAAGELIRVVGEHFGHKDAMIGHTFSPVQKNATALYPAYIYQDEPCSEMVSSIISTQNGDSIRRAYFSTYPGHWPENMYFAGDSFRFAPARILAEQFQYFTCVNRYSLDLEDVAAMEPDVFVLSAVGRMAKSSLSMIDGFNTAALPLTDVRTEYTAPRWVQDQKGYRWLEEGSYLRNVWKWLDGDKDGIYECYYFDGNGYCLLNTTTPDGYRVDAEGAWIENGVVQTRTDPEAETQPEGQAEEQAETQAEGQAEGQTEGQAETQSEGQTEGQAEAQEEGQTEGQAEA